MDRHRPALRVPAPAAGWTGPLLLAVPLAFLVVFFLLPVTAIVLAGLRPDGAWDLSAVPAVLSDAGLLGVLGFTVWQAVASTLLTLLLGLPGAYVVARYDFPGRALLRSAVVVPFVLPTVVVGTAFLALVGPRGVLRVDLSGSVAAILLAHVFFNYAVVVRTVGGLLERLDPHQEEAARLLGASRWRAMREVTLPLVAPAVGAAALMVFLFTFTSFGAVLVLGGGQLSTLEVEIYRQTAMLLDLPVAAVLSLLQLVTVGAVLLAFERLGRRRDVVQRLWPAAEVARRPASAPEIAFVAAVLTSAVVLLGAPLAVLVERSLHTADGYGLAYYRALGADSRDSTLFVPPLDAVRNSLVFAVAATVVALAVGALAAFALARRTPISGAPRGGSALDVLLMLPLGTSAVTVGFGLFVALDSPPLDLRDSPVLVPLAQALVATPFVVRILLPVLRALDLRLREAAAVLGASPWRVWREIDLPLVARPLAVAAGFAFAVSLGEFGATVFLARPDAPTLTVAITRFLARPGELNVGQAMAASVLLMVITLAVVAGADRLRAGRAEVF